MFDYRKKKIRMEEIREEVHVLKKEFDAIKDSKITNNKKFIKLSDVFLQIKKLRMEFDELK